MRAARRVFGSVVAGVALVACSSADPSPLDSSSPSPSPSSAPSASPVLSLRIDPPSATSGVLLGAPPSTLAFRAFATRQGAPETDVTDEVAWTIDGAHIADLTRPGSLSTVGIGGKAKVTAALAGKSASASITLKLTGEVFLDTTDARARDSFAGVVDAARPLAIEYPPSGVIVPANLPPFEIQWTTVTGASLFRAHATSSDVLDITLYTSHQELTAPADVWSKMGASAPDEPIALAIEGVEPTSQLRHVSDVRTITVTAERIEQGAIYAHDCKNGGLVVVDFIGGSERSLATSSVVNQSTEQRVGHCTGCHQVARDGRRIGFTTLDNATAKSYFGALRFDSGAGLFTETIAPDQIVAPSGAFNPRESTTRPALLAAYAIPSQNISGLALLDPDTSLSLPSNVTELLAAVPPELGKGATGPAWSSHGDAVAFTAWPNDANPGAQPQEARDGSLVEASIAFDGMGFHFGPPKVLVKVAPGENNVRAAYDDGDDAIVFMRTTTLGASSLGSALIYRRADGRVIPIEAGKAEAAGAWETRLPDWGPASGSRYEWIVVASNRPYGHRLAQGQYQLWAFAIDRARLASGNDDPSAPAFRLPGQSLDTTYTHPQWPRAMMSLK